MKSPAMMFDRKLGRLRAIHNDSPITSSAALHWTGVRLEHRVIPPFQFENVVGQTHVLGCHLTGPMNFSWRDHLRRNECTMNPGHVTLVPAHLPHSSSGDRAAEVILLHIQPSFIQLQAHRLGHNGPVELIPEQGVEDPLLSGLSVTLLEEVRRGGPNGPAYAETLLEALATHIIRRFGRPSNSESSVATIPMRHEMRRALEFIQERLVDDFSMRELAQFAGLSEFHFSRMFKKSVGLSPHQYVLQQRIERAKRMLMTGASNLAEVAIQCGFCDQSHFTSHFKRQTGLTPKRFADQSKERRFMEN